MKVRDGRILVLDPRTMVNLEIQTDNRVPEIRHAVFAREEHVVVHQRFLVEVRLDAEDVALRHRQGVERLGLAVEGLGHAGVAQCIIGYLARQADIERDV